MNIEDCEKGTRVICLNDSEGVIPSGSWGTVVEEYSKCPYISWDDNYSFEQFCYGSHMNTYALDLSEIEKLPETPTPEKEIAKLTVSVSVEDKEEIAKDILKIVLKDLNVIIADVIVSLSNDSLSNDTLSDDKDDELTGFDFSDEKLQHLLEEATKDVMKEIIREQIISLDKQDSTI